MSQVLALADSLRHVIAAKDSLLALAMTRPITINVPPASVSVDANRDWFDVFSLVATLVVAPVVGLVAAFLGARVGGREARKAAIEVQQRDAADARRLKVESRRENELRERALLLRRFDRDIVTTSGIADGLRTAHQITPVMPVSAANLRAMWDSFVRRRDAVMLLADPDLEHEVEFFYEWAFSRSAFLQTWLEAEQGILGRGNPDVDEVTRRTEVAEGDIRRHVERAQQALPRLRARVEELARPLR